MYNPLLLLDFYKVCHSSQYPKGLTKLVSYYTPRMNRLKDTDDKVTVFGIQGFIKEYLIKNFNKYFFELSEEEVLNDYNRVLTAASGEGSYDAEKIINLHRLGYLPLQIFALPEGMRTPIGVPQIEIINTHPDFVWLVNTIETLLSDTLWHTQISAEVGYRYRQIVQKYKDLSCDDNIEVARLLGDFSMRGQQSAESAIKSSAAWCLSFLNTATVPAILWLEENYNCDCTKEPVAFGAISTEHSVMCSNFAVDGDEITHIKRLLTEIYPNHSFSMVSDSYDYWNLVDNLLPQCKKEIMEHNGTLSIRGDSGDPVEVIAGKNIIPVNDEDLKMLIEKEPTYVYDFCQELQELENSCVFYLENNSHLYQMNISPIWDTDTAPYSGEHEYITGYHIDINEIPYTSEIMGTVWALDQIFGSTVNSKGFKVLCPKVKAIYGDSITPQRCEEIYKRLINKGYAINNVSLGVGSFSFMCLEGKYEMNPYTRDTFGIAVKSTYAEDQNGNPIMIYKQPKALSWKKSQRGCCAVVQDEQGNITYTDGLTWNERNSKDTMWVEVFKDGKIVKEYTLSEVRNNMYPNGF